MEKREEKNVFPFIFHPKSFSLWEKLFTLKWLVFLYVQLKYSEKKSWVFRKVLWFLFSFLLCAIFFTTAVWCSLFCGVNIEMVRIYCRFCDTFCAKELEKVFKNFNGLFLVLKFLNCALKFRNCHPSPVQNHKTHIIRFTVSMPAHLISTHSKTTQL